MKTKYQPKLARPELTRIFRGRGCLTAGNLGLEGAFLIFKTIPPDGSLPLEQTLRQTVATVTADYHKRYGTLEGLLGIEAGRTARGRDLLRGVLEVGGGKLMNVAGVPRLIELGDGREMQWPWPDDDVFPPELVRVIADHLDVPEHKLRAAAGITAAEQRAETLRKLIAERDRAEVARED